MTTETKIHQSKKSGPFIVIDKSAGVYTVQFINTGSIVSAGGQWVNQGMVTDPLAPTVHGMGCIGEGPHGASIINELGVKTKSPAYTMWANMLARCYVDPTKGKRPTYATCEVHPDWLNFQTFCQDIRQLEGYGLWAAYHAGMGTEKIELDKDVLCRGMDKKIYGPNTCQFMTKSDNLKAMWAERREVQA
ncbi:hypothetical protein [Aeromonas phage 14AhydR10PP]|nr:hypothetical protein [Aeromonas phage 14AhydR10PP]